jgi:hypothetical protein
MRESWAAFNRIPSSTELNLGPMPPTQERRRHPSGLPVANKREDLEERS